MKRVLITGADGMLGTELMRALAESHEVIGVDLGELDINDIPSDAAFFGHRRVQERTNIRDLRLFPVFNQGSLYLSGYPIQECERLDVGLQSELPHGLGNIL